MPSTPSTASSYWSSLSPWSRWLIDHGPASAPAKWNPSWLRASGMCPFRNQLCRISIPADTAKADRREVDPPIQVETARWSTAGQLDWWVKERREWWGAYAVQTAVKGGSELLIFGPKRAERELSLSFVVRRAFTQCRIRLSGWVISLLRFDMHPRVFLSFPWRLARSSR